MKLLTIRDVSAKIRLGKTKIYYLIGKSEFPKPLKIGTQSRWVEGEIDDWIKSRGRMQAPGDL